MPFLLLLFLLLFPLPLSAEWTSEGLTETQQFELAQQLFDDQLYYSSYLASKSYLKDSKNAKHTKAVLFLFAQASELASNHPQISLNLFNRFHQRYPKSQQTEKVLFSKGRLNMQLGQVEATISLLKHFFQKFPDTSSANEGHYWLGQALFYKATAEKKKQNPYRLLYLETITHLLSVTRPARLKREYKIKRMYFLGWAYHYRNEVTQARKWFSRYLRKSKDTQLITSISYQLAQNEFSRKKYKDAHYFFSKLDSYPDSPQFISSRFWKAESSYLTPGNSSGLDSTQNISLYEDYLITNDSHYRAITYYRLGYLYKDAQRLTSSINSFEHYLESDNHTDFHVDSYYQLGQLYNQTQDYPRAIESWEKARTFDQFKNSASLFQNLEQVYSKTKQISKQQQILTLAKNNQQLTPQQRNFFKMKWIQLHFRQNQCNAILKELKRLPQSKDLTLQEYQFLQYSRGSCRVQKKKWKQAQKDLESLKQVPEYTKTIFPLLALVYQKQKKWKPLGAWMNASWKKKDTSFKGEDFQLWIYADYQTKSWKRILLTYKRWEKKYPKQVQTPKHLIDWAQVAERQQQKEFAFKLYKKTLPLLDSSETELRKKLTIKILQQLNQQQKWKEIPSFIYQELSHKSFSLNSTYIFDSLLLAETKQSHWQGILKAYHSLSSVNPEKAKSLKALLWQGQAAEQLKKTKEALQFYQQAWNAVPKDDSKTRTYLMNRLGSLYESQKDIKAAVRLYEQYFPSAVNQNEKRHYAFMLGYHYLKNLKQEKQAVQWLTLVDQKGVSDQELNAEYWLLELEQKAKESKKAIQRIKRVLKRPVPKKSHWYLLFNFQLGILYQSEQKWKNAKVHYIRASAVQAKGYEAYRKESKRLANEIAQYLRKVDQQNQPK